MASSGGEGNLDALKVRFTHANTVRPDGKAYTIYEIEVRSASTITWVIYKRYNDFFKLHEQLSALSKSIRLPALPAKRLTRILAAEFVEKRKAELQTYLVSILEMPQLRHQELVLNFLETPPNVRPMLQRVKADESAAPDPRDSDALAREDYLRLVDYRHKSPEEKRVYELICSLAYAKNKVAGIKAFEGFYFDQRPRLDAGLIRTLLQGDPTHEKTKESGLLQTCGDFAYSHVASRAALDLLVRLMDVEKNKDAHHFVDAFIVMELSALKRMQLHLHILSERGNRLGAFKLVSVLHSRNPDLAVERLVPDIVAKQEYFKWAERKNEPFAPALTEPQEVVVRSPTVDASNFKAFADSAFEDIVAIAHNDSGWRQSLPSRAAAAGDPQQAVVLLSYKLDQRPWKDATVVRLVASLAHPSRAVAQLLLDLSPRRREWDPMFYRGRKLEKFDSTTDMVHLVFRSSSSPYKYRDFCLMRSWTRLPTGGRVIAFRSVISPKMPESKDYVRAVMYPTGYIVTPEYEADGTTERGCLLTYVAQLDREGVLIVAPDLLGETNHLCQGIARINALLSQDAAEAALAPSGAPPTILINAEHV